ncbi:DUF3693 domain-containing protein [Methylibium sp. Root1272]|uniref:DUF3693 domain-containing protein n=1 Tax=Methylibium sp. Root1272 TaxID=1736441 RepID=UPI0006F63EDC|nr:DUF3693 domain-containing protein [Methylibium sp. Root1272]KQW76600.1 hypothetical protein ASC67_02810 [Methylibium sp. Root1272]
MLTTQELLAAAKAANDNCSSYRLARLCDVPEKTMMRWVSGKNFPDDAHATRLAELAGLDAADVLTAINAERATEPAVRAVWESIAKRLHANSATSLAILSAVVLSALFGFDGGPDAGAALLSSVAITAENAGIGLYIM